MTLRFQNSYADLGSAFSERVLPTPVSAPGKVLVHSGLSRELGSSAEELGSREWMEVWSGNRIPEGATPVAMAYAGHQFGHFVPRLGDGRAILLGEVFDHEHRLFDVHLKGSGRTPFSRGGDGRCALGPALREFLVSASMHALGVPTTRGLAVVTTGEPVFREQALPGAVFVRVARSHLRVGTFEYFAARGDRASLERLVTYAIERHYPLNGQAALGKRDSALYLLSKVMDAQAALVGRWMGLGFVHGVMNTDNSSIAGETIDYGPCAFMDAFAMDRVFSSIDHGGRYAYGEQPKIAYENLARLAEALLPLLDEEEERAANAAMEVIGQFPGRFREGFAAIMAAKLGLSNSGDAERLYQSLLLIMARAQSDFTVTFSALLDLAEGATGAEDRVVALLGGSDLARSWTAEYLAALSTQGGLGEDSLAMMRRSNPRVIARNHQVERAIAAAYQGDFDAAQEALAAFERPYVTALEAGGYDAPPGGEQFEYKTFCGT